MKNIKEFIGIITIVFEIVYLVLYILDEILEKEKVKLENILWVASLLALISYFVP